jgi:hypothetical protein
MAHSKTILDVYLKNKEIYGEEVEDGQSILAISKSKFRQSKSAPRL